MVYRDRSTGFSFGYGLTPWVKRLLIANVVIYLALKALPPSVGFMLAFIPERILVQPWGVVTYMFVHGDFFHLFFNLIILFFFGPPLEGLWGGKEFLKFYLVSGLGGAVLSLLAPGSAVIGASGALYGVMLAFAMNWPDMPIHIWGILPVKAKWLVGFMAAVSFLSLSPWAAQDGIAHFAHLGGFAGGYLYLKLNDDLTNRLSRLREFVDRRKLSVSSGAPTEPDRPAPRARGRRDDDQVLDEVDRVLDKISESGLQSLSEDEVKLLDQVSRKYRQN